MTNQSQESTESKSSVILSFVMSIIFLPLAIGSVVLYTSHSFADASNLVLSIWISAAVGFGILFGGIFGMTLLTRKFGMINS